ncbi:All-trans-phytoene synthase [Corynebacterium glaucum]|uniref:All-trans-phytoene synthase n=1 Tax=Corynebacterium glaucum TaxID=187491 RepID=A0A1Q2HVE9_9CORY|nr:phytoene/squalene synthase family protein [Corynebacterium glaucum]AQQ14828.1 All-trans-phytoene synthase [Corynebacterium glaucum]
MAPNPVASYLSRYDDMCDHAAAQVIARYSTSFSLATRFLGPGLKRDIRNLYAMVRIADEIVDGTAAEASTDPATLLDAYEAQVRSAPEIRFHTDPVIHAYAQSARRCGFRDELVQAFFASMRRDLKQTTYTDTEFSDYVYGSAEVIGLLCLSAFLVDYPITAADREELECGARALGSAFQKINFLRDFGEDFGTLGRNYFPQFKGHSLDDGTLRALIADIRSELDHAKSTIPLLPTSARPAVAAAEALFRELTDMVAATPASELAHTRISVPNRRKLFITARAVARSRRPVKKPPLQKRDRT